MRLLSVKAVPLVYWSSTHPLNLRPRFITLLLLCMALTLVGIADALLIAAGVGVSPWVVLAQGIANIAGWSVGLATFVVSLAVLLCWIPLRQRPGIGTVMNILIIAAVMDYALPYLPSPNHLVPQLLQAVAGILLAGLGSGFYLIANLGPGPRDGLMTGLQGRSKLPIAWVRMAIEIVVVILGWLLGGVVGAGTLMCAFGIGWSVSIGLYVVAWCSAWIAAARSKLVGSD